MIKWEEHYCSEIVVLKIKDNKHPAICNIAYQSSFLFPIDTCIHLQNYNGELLLNLQVKVFLTLYNTVEKWL